MSRRYRPRSRLRNEIFSLALVFLAPFALISVFPFSALCPNLGCTTELDEALCAFVELSPAEVSAALAAARVAWQNDRDATRRIRADLFSDTLPPMPPREVGMFQGCACAADGRILSASYEPDPLPLTRAAPPPGKIAPSGDAVKPTPAFSREELLRLN